MTTSNISGLDPFVMIDSADETNLAVPEAPLRRLNYFDGKFLRGSDLELEQRYLRSLVEYSNQAGGSGVVHGYSVRLTASDGLTISPGLAIDVQGRVLLLARERTFGITRLIESSRQLIFAPKGIAKGGTFAQCEVVKTIPVLEPLRRLEVYVISVAFAEALCGEEDVYGKICEQACVTDTARPLWIEGVTVRVRPLELETPLKKYASVPFHQTHLRSRIASAYFADEAARIPSLISGSGLANGPWCEGAQAEASHEIDIAIIARSGAGTIFLDPWVVRRERIEAPARRYWAWRMRMRPWDVFLAQVLQFQCQLKRLFGAMDPGLEFDACAPERELIRKAAQSIKSFKAELAKGHVGKELSFIEALKIPELPGGVALSEQLTALLSFDEEFKSVLRRKRYRLSSRILIDGGIVELPSAGYLPVDLKSRYTIQEQVRQLMGEGVDLRFCAVRTDFVAHALEEAQHMDRIDLVQGIENPADKPAVDILVPDAEIELRPKRPKLLGYEVGLNSLTTKLWAKDGEFLPSIPASMHGAMLGAPLTGAAAANEHIAAASTTVMPRISTITSLFGRGGRVVGAGRAEALAGGGGAFYFAGMSASRMMLRTAFHSVADAIQVMAADHVAKPASRTGIMDRFAFAAKTLQERELKTAKAASTAVPADERANLSAGGAHMLPHAPFDTGNAALPTMHAGDVAIWSSLRMLLDPFRLRRNEQAQFDARVVIGTTPAAPNATDVRVEGRFTLTDPVRTIGGVRSIEGDIDGRVSFEVTKADATAIEFSLAMRSHVKVESYDQAGTQAIKLTIVESTGGIVALVTMPGILDAGTDAELFLGFQLGTSTVYFAHVGLTEDQDIFSETNALHERAVAAIDFIGPVLQEDPQFAEREKQNLFAPVSGEEPEHVIHARRDWVLFHRRRTKDCEDVRVTPVQKPTPKPRTYTVYNVYGATDAAPGAFARLKADQGDSLSMEAKRIGDVQFDEGSAQLVPASEHDFAALWAAGARGNRLRFGVIGSTGVAAADGAPVCERRLQALAGAISRTTTADAGLAYFAEAHAIRGFDSAGREGCIVLITDQLDIKMTTHDVFTITGSTTNVLKEIKAKGFGGAHFTRAAHKVGGLRVGGSTADATSLKTLATRWTKQKRALGEIVVARTADSTTDLVAQANEIAQRLSPNKAVRVTEVVVAAGTVPGNAAMILVPSPRP